MGGYREDRTRLLEELGDRARGNRKSSATDVSIGHEEKIYIMRVVKCWDRLPGEAVGSPSLEIL